MVQEYFQFKATDLSENYCGAKEVQTLVFLPSKHSPDLTLLFVLRLTETDAAAFIFSLIIFLLEILSSVSQTPHKKA